MTSASKTAAVAALAAQLTLGCGGYVRAQEAPPRFELTPHAGYRIGGTFEQRNGGDEIDVAESDAQGILFNFRASANTQWEVLYARQNTRFEAPVLASEPPLHVRIEYLHFGGTYLFEGRHARPFVALTAGVSRFEPGPEGGAAENYVSGSLGGGVLLRSDKRVGLRLEGRVFANLIDSDTKLFCSTGPDANVCAVNVASTVLVQWEARAGVVFRF